MKDKWGNGQNATNAYRSHLAEVVKPGMTILHAGCGWDKNDVSRRFKNSCKVVGVDLDPRVESRFHSEFHLGSLDSLPFPAEKFDVIFSEYVFEHLANPELALAEMARVLKPNGVILILTPNYHSYKTIAARLTPQKFHVQMGRHRYGSGHEDDMYPTLFRCNTESAYIRIAKRTGLTIVNLSFVTNGPTWFAKIPGLFELFHVFHLAIQNWNWFRKFRCALIVELVKASQSGNATIRKSNV
jgi:ubiquinone/menaquinone biosynthesis C-methylase UbiE